MMRARLREESGIALVMALGVMLVLAVALASIVQFTSASSQGASRQNADQQAHTVAEAGLNNALAVLNQYYSAGVTFPGDACVLRPQPPFVGTCPSQPPFTSTYDGRQTTWWGRLTSAPGLGWYWEIRSTGVVNNPTGPGTAPVSRTVMARVPVTIPDVQNISAGPLNWIYSATNTVITNSVEINSPFWANGNLTFANTARVNARLYVRGNLTFQGNPSGGTNMTGGPLYVGGLLWLDHSNAQIGMSGSPLGPADTDLVLGCKFRANTTMSPCVSGDASKVYIGALGQNIGQNVQPHVLDEDGTPIPPPERKQDRWDFWYAMASPGPHFPCETGSLPVQFDNDTMLNNSMPTLFNLTPPTGYSCKTREGELTWEPGLTPPRLTIDGTIFIDGSAKVETPGGMGAVRYRGQGTLYLSGTFLVKNSRLCAEISAGACDTGSGAWNPNEHAFLVNTDGSGTGGSDSPPVGYGIEVRSGHFQGGLWAKNSIRAVTSGTVVHGPIISTDGAVEISQSGGSNFPSIHFAPVGALSNPPPPAVLTRPLDFSG